MTNMDWYYFFVIITSVFCFGFAIWCLYEYLTQSRSW